MIGIFFLLNLELNLTSESVNSVIRLHIGQNPGVISLTSALEILVNVKDRYDANKKYFDDRGVLPHKNLHSRTSIVRSVLLHDVLMSFPELDSIGRIDQADANRQLSRRRSMIYDTCLEVTEAMEKGKSLAGDKMRRDAWFASLNDDLRQFVRGDFNQLLLYYHKYISKKVVTVMMRSMIMMKKRKEKLIWQVTTISVHSIPSKMSMKSEILYKAMIQTVLKMKAPKTETLQKKAHKTQVHKRKAHKTRAHKTRAHKTRAMAEMQKF